LFSCNFQFSRINPYLFQLLSPYNFNYHSFKFQSLLLTTLWFCCTTWLLNFNWFGTVSCVPLPFLFHYCCIFKSECSSINRISHGAAVCELVLMCCIQLDCSWIAVAWLQSFLLISSIHQLQVLPILLVLIYALFLLIFYSNDDECYE